MSGGTGFGGLNAAEWARYIAGPYEAGTPQGDAHSIGALESRMKRYHRALVILAEMIRDGFTGKTFAEEMLEEMKQDRDALARWKDESDKEDRLEARARAFDNLCATSDALCRGGLNRRDADGAARDVLCEGESDQMKRDVMSAYMARQGVAP